MRTTSTYALIAKLALLVVLFPFVLLGALLLISLIKGFVGTSVLTLTWAVTLLAVAFVAYWLFRTPQIVPIELAPRTKAHLFDELNGRFMDGLLHDVPDHPSLAKLDLSAAVKCYEFWCGPDLLKLIRCHLAEDSHPIAKIHHAAVLFLMGFVDLAQNVLDNFF